MLPGFGGLPDVLAGESYFVRRQRCQPADWVAGELAHAVSTWDRTGREVASVSEGIFSRGRGGEDTCLSDIASEHVEGA